MLFWLTYLVFLFVSRSSLAKDTDSSIPVGSVLPFAGSNIPNGWLLCNGRSLLKAEFKELFAAIGNSFNTESLESKNHFQLPDLRGRTVVGAGQGISAGLLTDRTLGSYIGVEKHTLSINEMPKHSHLVNDELHYPHHYKHIYVEKGTEHYYLYHWNGVGAKKTELSLQANGSSHPHENMQPSAVVNFIIKAGAQSKDSAATPVTTSPWPRPEQLQGFWPLDSRNQLRDLSGNHLHGQVSATVLTTRGPFAVPGSAMVPESANDKILEVINDQLSVQRSSFTVALFFAKQRADNEPGGIFEFIDKYNTKQAFQVRYINDTTIELAANDQTIGFYTLIQQKGVWTFMAFVFEKLNKMMSIYGKHGVIARLANSENIEASGTFNNNGIRLGYTTRWRQGLQTTVALSCLSVYSAALKKKEIRQLIDACRKTHGALPCGTPKLDIPPIPNSAAVTKIAKPGQFPFVALVRYSDQPACSATIIDDYWLLSSRSCFANNRDPAFYTVHIGVHDPSVVEAFTRVHTLANIIITQSNDLALIEVTEPIDFSNDYVNDACLFHGDQVNELKLDDTQFIFGWGAHGRRPMTSHSVGRYVPGTMLSEVQCRDELGYDDYDQSRDFCFMSTSVDKNIPCKGDEGSPLLVEAHSQLGGDPRLMQVGVYYKRDHACSNSKPALITNIGVFRSWIATKIACAVPGVFYPESCSQK